MKSDQDVTQIRGLNSLKERCESLIKYQPKRPFRIGIKLGGILVGALFTYMTIMLLVFNHFTDSTLANRLFAAFLATMATLCYSFAFAEEGIKFYAKQRVKHAIQRINLFEETKKNIDQKMQTFMPILFLEDTQDFTKGAERVEENPLFGY